MPDVPGHYGGYGATFEECVETVSSWSDNPEGFCSWIHGETQGGTPGSEERSAGDAAPLPAGVTGTKKCEACGESVAVLTRGKGTLAPHFRKGGNACDGGGKALPRRDEKATKRVRRFDRGELSPPERMDNGWLRAEGKIARVGIQEYEDADGHTHRELRLPEEVFAAESLRSFQMVPVTNLHPPVLLDDKNTRSYQVGHVGESVRREGDFVVAPLLITSSEAVTAASLGRSQLSNGYTCELDSAQDPVLTKAWGDYDVIQRRIQGNHVALVDTARAGPEARIRLDAGSAMMVESPKVPKETPMAQTLRIDSLTIDAAAPDAQAAIDRTLAAMKERADGAVLAEKKRADTAEKKTVVVKANAVRLIGKVEAIRETWDAMKARMAACEECDGKGKVTDEMGKEGKCSYCDGKGSYRMHDMIKSATPADDDEEGGEEEEMEEAVGAAEETDEDELETEQETEEKAGAAAKKGDAAERKRAKARRDAAAEREEFRRARKDSRERTMRRAMRTRLDLERGARRFLDEEDLPAADLAKLDDVGVMKAIVKKLSPSASLDGKSAVEIRARYDAEVERVPEVKVEEAAAFALRAVPNLVASPQRSMDPKAARAAYIKRLDEQAKGKAAGNQK